MFRDWRARRLRSAVRTIGRNGTNVAQEVPPPTMTYDAYTHAMYLHALGRVVGKVKTW